MDFNQDIKACLEVLQKGGTILYPTDTIWGLGADATNESAIQKIYELKQRPATKSMIILLADERDLLQYVANPDLQVLNYLKQTTKPTTVIFEGALGLAPNLPAEDGSVAIRIVKDTFCRHLIKRFRKPIVSTSANISGKPSPSFFHEIEPEIINAVDYTVEYRRDDTTPASPSTIIKWNRDSTVTVIRP